MDCRVVLAQTNPLLGDLKSNLADHLTRIERATAGGADLILFPELSLTGYFLKDQTYDLAQPTDSPALRALTERSHEISIGLGFVERGREGRIYNAYAFLEQGRVLHVHRKVHLVTYGMFDESRDFAPGESFEPIESRHGRFGVLVCEDMWHIGGRYLHFLNDVDAMIVPSASPGRGAEANGSGLASVRAWNTLLAFASLFTQTYLLFANRVGFEDGIGFSGHSSAWDPFGREIASLASYDPGALEARLSSAELHRARALTPLRRDEKPWVIAHQLLRMQGLLQREEAAQA